MKHFLFGLLILVSIAATCNKQPKVTIPVCIQQRIAQIQKEPRWNPPAQVIEYLYDGQRVFLFSANCCDQFNVVVTQDCNNVCAPSGGITGKGDRKCDDFFTSAKEVRVVWRDER